MTGTTRAVPPPAPPTEPSEPEARWRVSRSTRSSTVGTATFAVAVVGLALVPWWAGGGVERALVLVLYYLSLAQLWNLLAGYAGLVSIGQQAFVGIGAYTLVVAAEDWGVDPFLSILLAGVVAAVLSVPVALFAFRLRAGAFAVGTWVIAEVFRLFVLESQSLGAGQGRSLTRQSLGGYSIDARNHLTYWIALALGAGSVVLVVLVLRSPLGLALRAIRDSEPGARGLGVGVYRAKLFTWVLAAGWTGATGALIFLNALRVQPETAFSVQRWAALVIFVVVIGGVGTTVGPIIGVAVLWFVTERIGGSDTWQFIVLGLVAVVVAAVTPTGVWGFVERRWPIQLFPVRRHLERSDA
jgi:branched-chain amino acid transport system permease protein